MDYIMKKIDKELWRKVKIMAASQEMTIKQIIIDSLTDQVERFEGK